MKNILSFIFLFLGIVISQGQTTGQISMNSSSGGPSSGVNAQIRYLMGPISQHKNKLESQGIEIQGSAYTSETFLPTKLYYKDEYQGDMFYRFNAYNEEIELKDIDFKEAPVKSLQRDKNLFILVNGNPMSFKTYIDKKGLTQNGYLTKLIDGKYSFYKRYDVKYTEGQKAQNSFVKAIPARFSKFTEYYIEIDGVNRIDELELNNRKLIKLMPNDKKESLKTYLKENKIKIKNEQDLFKVLTHLNS